MEILWLLVAGSVFLTSGGAKEEDYTDITSTSGEAIEEKYMDIASTSGGSIEDEYMDIANTLGVYAVQQGTTCPCGSTNKKRIIGGTEAGEHEFRSAAAIVKMIQGVLVIFCSGSIITPWHILTMIHCFFDDSNKQLVQWKDTSVIVGSSDYKKGKTYRVKDGITHEKYDPKNIIDDIAILVLLEKIDFSGNIEPACLPKMEMNLVGKSLTFIGWGDIGSHQLPNIMRKVDIKVVEIRKCTEAWLKFHKVDPQRQICTQEPQKEPCEGDSGGAGFYFDPTLNKYIQYASVDYGGKCGLFNPSVQLNVAYYLSWIKAAVRRHFPDMIVCTPV